MTKRIVLEIGKAPLLEPEGEWSAWDLWLVVMGYSAWVEKLLQGIKFGNQGPQVPLEQQEQQEQKVE